ncbi:MAG: hypothetical protein OEV64_02370 [Desulfobulbaceae bacterium]|nr:hypothetical protein [Desulfobulbaceae bacterium]
MYRKYIFFIIGICSATFYWFLETIIHVEVFEAAGYAEQIFPVKNPNELWMRLLIVTITLLFGLISQKLANKITTAYQREKAITIRLEQSLDEIKILRGILPICASCKKIRDDQGYWNQIEAYFSAHSEAQFSHSICPECLVKLYPKTATARKTLHSTGEKLHST